MAISRNTTWSSGEVLTASALNAEFNNILNNAADLISPLTKSIDMNGFELVLDADADTSITADTDDRLDFRLGGVDLFVFDGTTASSVNGLTLTGVITGARPRLSATGSDTNIGMALRPKGTGAGASVVLEDGNGNEVLIGGVATASAVNEVTITNAATGTPPIVAASGEANTGLRVTPNGTGLLDLRNSFLDAMECRLTLTSGTAVTTGDVTAATTVYLAPFRGSRVVLFDGTDKWIMFALTEISVAVPATTNTMYDVFVYNNAGTLTLDATAWTNDTTRATALTTQNGVYVKTGATARRYVGSFRTTGVSGQTEDSAAKRYVWNYYNRIPRRMKVTETNSTWNYSTAAYRQANGAATNQIDFVIGVSETPVTARVFVVTINSTATIRQVIVSIGLDVTNDSSATLVQQNPVTSAQYSPLQAFYNGYPGIGRHFLAWVEFGGGADTQTWIGTGTGATAGNISGIAGEIMG